MKILLIRHAIAVAREEFQGSDLDRPLTDKGKKRARRAFAGLERIYPGIQKIFTSPAVRAHHSARLLKRQYPEAEVHLSDLLLPEAQDDDSILSLIQSHMADTIAIVGHEPNLTRLAGTMLGSHSLPFELSKAGVLVIETDETGSRMESLLTPRILRRVYG
jgi:phosphohistidine phosphatase